jgi:hypothetical protein
MARHVQLVDGHALTPIRASIASWRARGSVAVGAGWRALTEGAFREETLECSHYELLQPPFVLRVATALDAALLKADAANLVLATPEREVEDDRRRPRARG